MKSIFLAGGFAGFVLCAAAGLAAGRTPGLIFRDAAVGCLVSALLARWFWLVLLRAFAQTLAARRKAAAQAAAAAHAAAQAAQAAGTPKPGHSASPMPPNPRPAAPPRPHLVTATHTPSPVTR